MNFYKRNSDGSEMDDSTPGYKDRPYYVRFELNGKAFNRSTKCAVRKGKGNAEDIGEQLYQNELSKTHAKRVGAVLPEAPKVALPASARPTIAQLKLHYMTAPTGAKAPTRTQTLAVLDRMLAIANLDLSNPSAEDVAKTDQLPVDAIGEGLANAWFDFYHATVQAIPQDQVQQNHHRNTANSQFGKVMAMFHTGLRAFYVRVGLWSDHYITFRATGAARRFKGGPGSTGINKYKAPPQEVIDAMLASWLKLEDRNVFIAAGFALSFGLRKGETMQVRWRWLRLLHGGNPGLSNGTDTVIVKGKSGDLETRALDPYYSQFIKRLDEMDWRGADDELVLVGGVAELETLLWDRLGKWLKSLKWTTDKMSHALRAYSGSKVYLRYGLESAQFFLRHEKAKTTEAHYSHFARRWPLTDEERAALPERFAVAPKATTNILPLPMAAAA